MKPIPNVVSIIRSVAIPPAENPSANQADFRELMAKNKFAALRVHKK
jgi:hypothetical protein